MAHLYRDRRRAGEVLAAQLAGVDALRRGLVIGLLRGGLPVAQPIAAALAADLDALPVGRMREPSGRTVGAVAGSGDRTAIAIDPELVRSFGVRAAFLGQAEALARRQLAECARTLSGSWPARPARGRIVVLVDDGMVTGLSMRAAVAAMRALAARRVVVAVPLAAPRAIEALAREADDVICPAVPDPLGSLAAWYEALPAVDEAEIRAILGSSPAVAESSPAP